MPAELSNLILVLLGVLLLLLPATRGFSYNVFKRQLGEEGEDFDDSVSSLIMPTPSQSPEATVPPREPVLSGDAIANIVCSFAAVVFLTSVLCYISYTFNKKERKTRIRTTLANNKLIDQQIAAARARAEVKAQNVHDRPLEEKTDPAPESSKDTIEMTSPESAEDTPPLPVVRNSSPLELVDNT